MVFRKVGFALAAALVALSTSTTAHAQSIFGGLRGLVVDQGGGAIANVKVTMTDEGTNVSRSTVTTGNGEYNFASVIPATYSIVAESPGFKKFERKGIAVGTQQFLTIDVKMEVGQVTESVLVNEEVPLIETATASQGQNIDRQKLIDLPNLGRNPYMFSRLAPNVQQVGNPAYARMQDQSGSSQISIAGGPVRGNNYLLDGVAITDMLNRAVIVASLEAVQEVKVQSNTYDAEIGRSGGGMFNAFLKSGTNTFHGSAGGYFRETSWLANSYFNNRAGRPVANQPFRNYFVSWGGPVWIPKVYDGRNKTFFFVVAEGYRDTQSNSGVTQVPTAAERIGDFSQSRISAANQALRLIYDPSTTAADGTRQVFPGNIIPPSRVNPIGRAIAATFPSPATTARFMGDANMPYVGILPSVADQKTAKFDHKITDWWNMNLSYLRYYSVEPGETWFPDTPSSPNQWRLGRNVDTTQINSIMTLNPTTVLAVRYGYNRFPNYSFQLSQGFDPATLGFNRNFVNSIPSKTFPNVSFQNFYTGTNMGTDSNGLVVPNSRNVHGLLSKFLGRHSLKFGADYRLIRVSGANFGNSSGQFSFDDQFTRANFLRGDGASGSDIASLLLGAPAAANGFVPTTLHNFARYYSGFFQDDIRLNSKLTINVGIRWEREEGLAERNNNMITGFDRNALNSISQLSGVPTRGAVVFAGVNGGRRTVGNPNLNKFSPRFGVAYQLNSKTTIRGGYGIFWAPQTAQGGVYLPEGFTASTQPLTTLDGGRTPNPATNLSSVFSGGLDQPVGNRLGDQTGIGKALTIFDPNARSPRVQQYSVDIQRELPFGIVMSVAYVGSRSNNLTINSAAINLNQVEPRAFGIGAAGLAAAVPNPYFNRGGVAGLASATVSNAQLQRPFPAFGNLNFQFADFGRASYDSLAVRAQKRLSQGMTFLWAWTWAKNQDNVAGGGGNTLNGGAVSPQNPYDLNAEWGLSNIDARHRNSLAVTYELPFGKGKKFGSGVGRWGDMVIGGWSMNLAGVINGGFPLQIRQAQNNNSVIFAASQRPNATGASPAAGTTKSSWTDGVNGVYYLNPAAFSVAPALTFGNVSRTISLRGPGQTSFDASLFKTFSVTEAVKVQFRFELLNAFNNTIFNTMNVQYGTPTFGQITSQANFPRFVQMGIRGYF